MRRHHDRLGVMYALIMVVVPLLVVLAMLLTPDKPTRCTEDMKCWDCKTMGNLRCGPTTDQSARAD